MAIITRRVIVKSEEFPDRSIGRIIVEEDVDDVTGEVVELRAVNGTDRAVRLYAWDENRSRPFGVPVGPGRENSLRFPPPLRFGPEEYGFGLNFLTGRSRPGSVGVPSELANNSNATSNTSIQVPLSQESVTPTANALLVLIAGARGTSGQSVTGIADTFGDTSDWTEITDVASAEGASGFAHHSIWWAKAGPSPDEGFTTVTWSGSVNKRTGFLVEVAGADTTTPVSESDSDTQASGTSLALVLASIAALNRSLASIYNLGNLDITPGANETEGTEINASGGALQWQYGTNNGDDASPSWSNLADDASAAGALEIAAAGGGAHSKAVIIG